MSFEVPATPQSPFESIRPVYLRYLAISLLCWSCITLLEIFQVYMSDAGRGYTLGPLHYFAWAIFNWYALAFFSPLVYMLGRRFPIAGPGWQARLIFPHLAMCAGWLAAQAIARGFAGLIYTHHHDTPSPLINLIIGWVGDRGVIAFFAYWIIVIIAGFAQLREEVRQRELHQAQLETRLASAELESLRMQIQPHFLFNTLQAAITLVRENPDAAEDVLLRLGQLLRIALDQMDSNEIPLARELEFLDLYTGIQRRRFGDRLSVEIHADDDTLDLQVPPLILQPLVENAIHHGIGKRKGNDVVEVFARREGPGLQIEVWNMNSRVEESTSRQQSSGLGLRNTRARLEHLYGPDASLIFRALAKGGAAALIYIPHPRPTPAPNQPAAQAT
ncbi:MAG TPA: histidine kinase [Terracidiphilus sp.]|nr:histidine kinase [Terracidiphilus sp.]